MNLHMTTFKCQNPILDLTSTPTLFLYTSFYDMTIQVTEMID